MPTRTPSRPQPLRPDWLWIAGLVAATLLVNVLTWTGTSSPLRGAVTAFYFFFCPGMAVIRPLRLRNTLLELVCGVALSISMAMLVSEILVYGQRWDALAGLRALSVIVLAGCAIQAVQVARAGAPEA